MGYDQRTPKQTIGEAIGGWVTPKLPGIIAGFLIGIVLLSGSCGSYYSVNEGERAVVTRLGAVSRIAKPGPHLKLPFIEDVTRMSVRTECYSWEHDGKNDSRMQTYSRDQQVAELTVQVCLRVNPTDDAVRTIYSQFKGTDGYWHSVVVPRAFVAVKEIFGTFNAIRVVQDRQTFNREVEAQVRKEIAQNNGGQAVSVDNISVKDIAFSKAYEQAVEQRMQAEVEVAKVEQNLARERKTAEIAVVQAQAQADAKLAVAKANASATKIQGEAEAAAIRARSEALRDSPKLVELTAVERWNGKLPDTMVPGGSLPFVHVK